MLIKHSILPRVKKYKILEILLERIASNNKVRYIKQEERAAKRIADDNPNYKDMWIKSYRIFLKALNSSKLLLKALTLSLFN